MFKMERESITIANPTKWGKVKQAMKMAIMKLFWTLFGIAETNSYRIKNTVQYIKQICTTSNAQYNNTICSFQMAAKKMCRRLRYNSIRQYKIKEVEQKKE